MNLFTAKHFQTGRVSGINNAGVTPLYSGTVECRTGVTIVADSGNAGVIFVGKQSVTVWSNVNTDGFPLRPGESKLFPVDEVSGIFLKSNTGAANNAFWFGA